MLLLPIEPIICVARIREWIVAAEIITGFGVLKKETSKIVSKSAKKLLKLFRWCLWESQKAKRFSRKEVSKKIFKTFSIFYSFNHEVMAKC
jgi:hypothetical protein